AIEAPAAIATMATALTMVRTPMKPLSGRIADSSCVVASAASNRMELRRRYQRNQTSQNRLVASSANEASTGQKANDGPKAIAARNRTIGPSTASSRYRARSAMVREATEKTSTITK